MGRSPYPLRMDNATVRPSKMTHQARVDIRVRNFQRCFNRTIERVRHRSVDFTALLADAGTSQGAAGAEDKLLARKLALIELRSIDTEMRDALRWLEMLQKEIGCGE